MINADRRHRCSELRENGTSARPEAGRTGGLRQPVPLSGLRPSQEREAAAGTEEKSREQLPAGKSEENQKARCRTLVRVRESGRGQQGQAQTDEHPPTPRAAPALQDPSRPARGHRGTRAAR